MLLVTYNITGGIPIFDPLPMSLNIFQGFTPFLALYNVIPDITTAHAANPQIVEGGVS